MVRALIKYRRNKKISFNAITVQFLIDNNFNPDEVSCNTDETLE